MCAPNSVPISRMTFSCDHVDSICSSSWDAFSKHERMRYCICYILYLFFYIAPFFILLVTLRLTVSLIFFLYLFKFPLAVPRVALTYIVSKFCKNALIAWYNCARYPIHTYGLWISRSTTNQPSPHSTSSGAYLFYHIFNFIFCFRFANCRRIPSLPSIYMRKSEDETTILY